MEISCFFTVKYRIKAASITCDSMIKTMLGQLLGASFYLIALFISRLWGKAELEVSLGVGLEQDRETHSPSARFRLQLQIIQPAATWELDSSCRVCSSVVLEYILIEGPPWVKWSLLQPPTGKHSAPVQGWDGEEILPGSLQQSSAWRGTGGKEQLLVQPGSAAAEGSALLRWMNSSSAVQPRVPTAETCLPDHTGKEDFTPNLRGRIEVHGKKYLREKNPRLLGTARFVPGWSIWICPFSRFVGK